MRRYLKPTIWLAAGTPAAALVAGFALAMGGAPPAVVLAGAVGLLVLGLVVAARRRAEAPQGDASGDDLAAAALATLNRLPDPVLLLDGGRRIVMANRAATTLLGDGLAGRDLALSLRNPDALEAAGAALSGAGNSAATITLRDPVPRVFLLYAITLPAGRAGAALILHETTAAHSAEQIRADFVANVSHELRSPLTSLTGFIETLKGPARDDPAAQARFLDIMEEESRRMARLIDDLLSLSRVEANEHVRPEGRVDIPELLAAVAESVAPQADEKNMAVVVAPHDIPAEAIGARDELFEVFQNLLVNAIKYGRAGTEVSVTIETVARIPEIGGPGVAVTVADRGEGIAAEDIPRLTERFYRVDKGRSRRIGGTGLGLAIVKHIVNRHRGRLAIHSTVGEGSRFTVYLPTAAPGPTPADDDDTTS